MILDEIRHTPEVSNCFRTRVDAAAENAGQWYLTGSKESPLMQGVTDSLASPKLATTWFRSYVQTYLERDVRAVSSVRDLSTFRRFVALVASRAGGIVNKTDSAAPLGVSIPTITQWLSDIRCGGLAHAWSGSRCPVPGLWRRSDSGR